MIVHRSEKIVKTYQDSEPSLTCFYLFLVHIYNLIYDVLEEQIEDRLFTYFPW